MYVTKNPSQTIYTTLPIRTQIAALTNDPSYCYKPKSSSLPHAAHLTHFPTLIHLQCQQISKSNNTRIEHRQQLQQQQNKHPNARRANHGHGFSPKRRPISGFISGHVQEFLFDAQRGGGHRRRTVLEFAGGQGEYEWLSRTRRKKIGSGTLRLL